MATDIELTVTEHGQTLAVLVGTVRRIEDYMKESVEFQRKLEVTVERLANYESNTKDSFNRVHHRIGQNEVAIQDLRAHCEKEFEEIRKAHSDKCAAIGPKAHSGHLAWRVQVWGGSIIGGAMLLALLAKVFGIGK